MKDSGVPLDVLGLPIMAPAPEDFATGLHTLSTILNKQVVVASTQAETATKYHEMLTTLLSKIESKDGDDLRSINLQCAKLAAKGEISASKDWKWFVNMFTMKCSLCQGWSRLCTIFTIPKNGSLPQKLDILLDNDKIKDEAIISHNWIRPDNVEADTLACMTMHMALEATRLKKILSHMEIYSDQIDFKGPIYLFYLARHLRDGRKCTINHAKKLMFSFSDDLRLKNFKFDTVTKNLISAIKELKSVDRPMSNAYDTIYRHLVNVPNALFVQKISEKRTSQKHRNVDDMVALLQHVLDEIIDDLHDIGQWKFDDTSKKESDLDIALLKAELTKVKSALSKSNKRPPGAPKPPSSKQACYNIGPDNFGPNITYKSLEDLVQFTNGSLTKEDSFYNGLVWKWCAHCNRMGNHKTDEHTGNCAKADAVGAAPVPKHKAGTFLKSHVTVAPPPPEVPKEEPADNASHSSVETYTHSDDE